MHPRKMNLAEKFVSIHKAFSPGVVGELNGQQVKVVEHQPVAAEETEVVRFEPASMLNTGNVTSKRTVRELPHI